MIKRYTLGHATLIKGREVSLGGPNIIESPDGEFVLYEDVEALLESIGAGGVSGKRITQKGVISKSETAQT